jgi:hypothetical protein
MDVGFTDWTIRNAVDHAEEAKARFSSLTAIPAVEGFRVGLLPDGFSTALTIQWSSSDAMDAGNTLCSLGRLEYAPLWSIDAGARSTPGTKGRWTAGPSLLEEPMPNQNANQPKANGVPSRTIRNAIEQLEAALKSELVGLKIEKIGFVLRNDEETIVVYVKDAKSRQKAEARLAGRLINGFPVKVELPNFSTISTTQGSLQRGKLTAGVKEFVPHNRFSVTLIGRLFYSLFSFRRSERSVVSHRV